jgi:ABC-type transport system involved in multi-copper enzyme maturation permease subunit
MQPVFTIAEAVIRDALRRKVMWVVLVFAAIMVIMVPMLPSYGAGVVEAVFREVSIALMFTAAMVISVAMAAVRIPAEVERRTVFAVLARDVRRWQYVAGTWVGLFALVGVAMLIFAITTIAAGAVVYGQVMLQLFEAALAIWLEMGVLLALAVMVSTRLGAVTTVIATLTFLFVGHSVSSLLPRSGQGAMAWLVPSLDVFNVINPVAHGSGYGLGYALSMLIVFTAWAGLLLGIGSALFSSRDL